MCAFSLAASPHRPTCAGLGGGGADRDRTGDPLLAKQVLSQLSYSPGCPAVAKATQRSRSGCSPAQRFFWLQVSCVGALRRLITLKEVIQPHLPIRLPCYDFTPVMNHTVVGVLLAVRLPASGAAHSHGVTGGVYKARERIHRGIADPRLLAIPTSWSRVADSNPDYDRFSGIGFTSRLRSPLYRPL